MTLPPGTKFDLRYSLRIENANHAVLTVGYPFTLDFDVVRDSFSYCNTATLRLYNLSDNQRDFLLHDQYDVSTQHALYVTLTAGYGPGPLWPVVFKGSVTRGYSVREGVDFVTVLEAFDGGMAIQNCQINLNYSKDQTPSAVLKEIVLTQLAPYGVSLGAVSKNFDRAYKKGGAYSGNALAVLREITNGNFFIDTLTLNALVPEDHLKDRIPLPLTPQSGFLETPVYQQQYLEVQMLFEPRVAIGTLVDLQSTTAKVYNGIRKCISIHHSGTISAAVSAPTKTILGLLAGVFASQGGR